MMKKTLLTAIACVFALGLTANTASALAIGDANYLGYVDPGSPANAEDEVFYINTLLGIAPGGTLLDVNPPPSPPNTLYDFSRVDSTLDCSLCPAATTAGADSGNDPATSVDVDGWTYLVAKYGDVSHVWYVVGLGTETLPQSGFGGFHPKTGEPVQNGLSHYSLYNPGEKVPDGGATAGLLGLAMLGLGYLRRRIG